MKRIFTKIVDVKPDEIRALWLGFLFNFMVLDGYYVMRPIRDRSAPRAASKHYRGCSRPRSSAMLIANAVFAPSWRGMSRRKFIPIAYRFFIVNLVIFSVLMRVLTPAQEAWLGRTFFVWLSVANLFVVTVFWAFMTDLFSNEQGKRLFGFISIGGSLGAIIGGSITASLVKPIGAANLLLVSAAMFEVAAQSVRFFPADFAQGEQTSQDRQQPTEEAAIGGSLWSGITHIFRSPYLFGLFAFIIFYSTTSTWAYFQQSDLAGHGFADRAARTTFFANLDRSVNTLTVLGQLFLTGRLLKWFGVTSTLDLACRR